MLPKPMWLLAAAIWMPAYAAPQLPLPHKEAEAQGRIIDAGYLQALRAQAADGGHHAIYQLGLFFLNGSDELGIKPDIDAAIKNLSLAADAGNGAAARVLGDVQWQGTLVQRDRDSAIEWYKVACGNGDARAALTLAKLYEDGVDLEKDPAKALDYYRLAALNPDAPSVQAQSILGYRYQRGTGAATRDAALAASYLTRAAASGDRLAQYNLGHLLINGPDQVGRASGVKWLETAAQAGSAEASRLLSAMYAKGHVVEANAGASEAYASAARKLTNAPADLAAPVETASGSMKTPAAAQPNRPPTRTVSDKRPDPAPKRNTMKVQAPYANVRDEPDTRKGKVITRVENGTEVEVVGRRDDWFQIKLRADKGPSGWIYGSLLGR